jgi:hypothetical protein
MAQETWKDYRQNKHFKPSPLKGIRVLEICTIILGPAGPGFLGALGAEVIKCELPPRGDTMRQMTPFGYFFRGQSPPMMHSNTDKYWLGLAQTGGTADLPRTGSQVRRCRGQFQTGRVGKMGRRLPAAQGD